MPARTDIMWIKFSITICREDLLLTQHAARSTSRSSYHSPCHHPHPSFPTIALPPPSAHHQEPRTTNHLQSHSINSSNNYHHSFTPKIPNCNNYPSKNATTLTLPFEGQMLTRSINYLDGLTLPKKRKNGGSMHSLMKRRIIRGIWLRRMRRRLHCFCCVGMLVGSLRYMIMWVVCVALCFCFSPKPLFVMLVAYVLLRLVIPMYNSHVMVAGSAYVKDVFVRYATNAMMKLTQWKWRQTWFWKVSFKCSSYFYSTSSSWCSIACGQIFTHGHHPLLSNDTRRRTNIHQWHPRLSQGRQSRSYTTRSHTPSLLSTIPTMQDLDEGLQWWIDG